MQRRAARVVGTRIVVVAILVALVASCTAATPPSGPATPPAELRTCSLPQAGADFTEVHPHEVGVDAALVKQVLDTNAADATTSLRIYRFGCLIGKTSIDYKTRFDQQQTFSATKSVVALVVGRAVTLGKLGLDDPIGQYLPEADAAHGAITVRQLLTQTSGLDFAWVNDIFASLDDSVRQALTLPFVHEPGTWFEYAQTTVTLLAHVVERAVGEDFQAFADRELFAPMGMDRTDWFWARDEWGHTHGYAWLNMTPVALGRLGALMLRNGKWAGTVLIDKAFIREMGEPTGTNGAYGLLTRTNRGDGGFGSFGRPEIEGRWNPAAPPDMVQFSGFLDQAVFVIPSLQMVIVRTGVGATPGWDHEMFRALVPAVRGRAATYDDPGPYVYRPTDVPIEELVDLPRLIEWIFGTGA